MGSSSSLNWAPNLCDSAEHSITRLSAVLSKNKHKELKSKCIECLSHLARLRTETLIRGIVEASPDVLEDESLALELYTPFQSCLSLISSRILLVTLDGIRNLAMAGLFSVRVSKSQDTTTLLADIVVRDLLEHLSMSDDTGIILQV